MSGAESTTTSAHASAPATDAASELIALNDGNAMPVLGIGTYLIKPADAHRSVREALQMGYRLVDTANAYGNERAVGAGIRESGVPREDVFLTTKLWPTIYKRADAAIDETLERLGTGYVDLLLLHQPAGDYVGAYQAMERAVADGKVRSIGLSNFLPREIDKIRAASTILPAVDQVETHPYFDQRELKRYLEPMGARVMAWYPLGHGDARLIDEPIFSELTERHGKTRAQIILRWHIQMGHIVIPGSRNEQHIRENLDVFDFELSDAEMAAIRALDKGRPYNNFTHKMMAGLLLWHPNFDEAE